MATDDIWVIGLELEVADRWWPLGSIRRRCPLTAVDDVLRLQLAVTRHGWRVAIVEADSAFVDLLELCGVRNLVGPGAVSPRDEAADRARRTGRDR